jgi:multicomponent Na+:H+ antiporter subunit B
MTRRARTVTFLVAAAGVASLFLLAFARMPRFGGGFHPYRNAAVPAALAHATSNVVSSINFDQRGLDTLAEESIFLASVIAVSVLLRPQPDEQYRAGVGGRVLDSTLLTGWMFLPVTLVIGLDVIAHGHLTPGGGFQGGVIAGTSIHLLYVAGRYPMLEKVRPVRPFEWGESAGAAAFVCVGVAGILTATAFLGNVISTGSLGTLFSSGTVGLLNGAVGVEVASGVVVLISRFLDQAIGLERKHTGGALRHGAGGDRRGR